MTQKDKAEVFDFLMTLGTFEFIWYAISMELFDYKPKRMVDKVLKFKNERLK